MIEHNTQKQEKENSHNYAGGIRWHYHESFFLIPPSPTPPPPPQKKKLSLAPTLKKKATKKFPESKISDPFFDHYLKSGVPVEFVLLRSYNTNRAINISESARGLVF